ncbi:MAG: hypothetical protein A2Z73_01240 [Deltaproteobacteria bacterium RBG_13_60_28]|nr:MAG: hypothetical protein A2Z73_01240 [Deltaproteobacteria bacterium RBG_13_60_28]
MNKTMLQLKLNFKESFIYDWIYDIRQRFLDQDNRKWQDWVNKGSRFPTPHVVKQLTVKKYAKLFSLNTLIETGTYRGDMLYATKGVFKRLFSLELDADFYERARRRLSKFNHISIIHGDSGEKLPELLSAIDEPCLFWLDAHAATGDQGCPLMQELNHIFNHPITDHVILIDDAQKFTGELDFPEIDSLRELVKTKRPGWVFEVKDYIIRIHPSPTDN